MVFLWSPILMSHFLHNFALPGPIFTFYGSNMGFPHVPYRLRWFLMVSNLIWWVKMGQKVRRRYLCSGAHSINQWGSHFTLRYQLLVGFFLFSMHTGVLHWEKVVAEVIPSKLAKWDTLVGAYYPGLFCQRRLTNSAGFRPILETFK